MKTTNKMSLRVWTNLDDDFDHEQLADNWAKLDAHDHTNGRGVQIPTEGISDEAITFELLAEELRERLFAATEEWSLAFTELKPGKPVTATARTNVLATIDLTAEVELVIFVGGNELTRLAQPSGVFPISFFVPKGVAWEWGIVSGEEEHVKFTYKQVEL